MATALAFSAKQNWAILGGIAAFSLVLVVLVRAGRDPARRVSRLSTDFIFWLGIAYLISLSIVAIMYMGNFYGIKDRVPVILGGILPVGVPWFGAVGAVVIGLQGVFDHTRRRDWDSTYNYWHIARPLFGAILAVVAFFIFLVLINAASPSNPKFTTPVAGATASSLAIYYIVAFLVGYREETFRSLVYQVTDLIFTAVKQPPDSALPKLRFEVGGVEVKQVDFGECPIGTASPPKEVKIWNVSGIKLTAPVVLVSSDTPDSGEFSKQLDTNGNPVRDEISTGKDLDAGSAGVVSLVFTPKTDQRSVGRLLVTSASLPIPEMIDLLGKGQTPSTPASGATVAPPPPPPATTPATTAAPPPTPPTTTPAAAAAPPPTPPTTTPATEGEAPSAKDDKDPDGDPKEDKK